VPVVALGADLRSNILPKAAINPITVSNNDNTVGVAIDTLNYGSVTFLVQTGTIADTDATFTVGVIECAYDNCLAAGDNSAATSVIGSASFTFAGDNAVTSIGVNPSKRYNKVFVTPANNTGSAPFSALAILGHPKVGAAQ
jgi:hypothetical protein